MDRAAATRKLKPDAEPFVARDAAALKALADPMRMQILLELAADPKTVKQVAAALETGPTRLYYHFKILERAGLIRVIERRMVSGIEERTYGATATSWTSEPGSTTPSEESEIVDALIEVVRAELELAIGAREGEELGEASSTVPSLVLTRLALGAEDVAEVQRRLESIQADFGETRKAPKGKRLYHAFFEMHLTPAELHRQS
ncbi:MAG: helix-turn-helix domain-containing protein [Actinomycetota bacterium]